VGVVCHNILIEEGSEHHGAHKNGEDESEWEVWDLLGGLGEVWGNHTLSLP